MKKNNFDPKDHKRRAIAGKAIALSLSLVLLAGGVVGGTVAWLTAQTNKVENVFTTSGIDVELKETTTQADYKMVPGWTMEKDPAAKVTSGSEDCYLFIQIEESGGNVHVSGTAYTFDSFIAYAVEDGWTALDSTKYPGVYYRVIDSEEEKNKAYNILGSGVYTDAESITYIWADNQVLTKPEVTKEMMAAVKDSSKPTLSFTAYAVQLWKSNEPTGENITDAQTKAAQFTAEQAWLKVSSNS